MSDKENVKKSSGGLFKKLSNLVFEETESTEVSQDNSDSAQVEGAVNKFVYSDTQSNNSNPQVNLNIPNANGVFDQKFYSSFIKLIEDNNIEGVDYLEFSKAKRAMDNIPGMAEQVKYQSAFATLGANSQITKEHLLTTADFYIEKLDSEAKEFEVEMSKEIEAQVNARIDVVKNKEGEIASKREAIERAQAEINALQTEIGQVNVEAQQYKFNIESTAKNFKATLEAVKAQINADKQNIQNFI